MNDLKDTIFRGPVTFDAAGSISPPAPTAPGHAARVADVTAALAGKQPAADELGKVGVQGADIASASTINLETATGESVNVTGTTAISAVTLGAGHLRMVRFTGVLTLTHGSSLLLPGSASIVTAANDFAWLLGYTGGVVRCVNYQRAAGVAEKGTVTSAGLSMPGGFSVAGSPVTSAGILAVTCTLSGLIKGDGASNFSAAVAGTDYLAPAAIGVTVQAFNSTLDNLAGKTIEGTGNIVLKTYVESAIASAVTGLQDLKGSIDCSANPNYPAASNGDAYRVSVAGRIGGASGPKVSVGDMIIAFADNAGGTQASVGASWSIGEGNIEGITAIGTAAMTAATPGAASYWRLNTDGTLSQLSAAQMLSAIAAASSAVTLTAAGLVTGGGDLMASRSFAVTAATQAEAEAGSATNVAMTPLGVAQAINARAVDPPPFNAGNLTGTVTLARANGRSQKAALTGDVTLAVPTGGSDGKQIKVRLTASGADRALDLHAAILLPSASTTEFPVTLTSGKSYLLLLEHNGTAWWVVSLVGGY